MLVPGNEASRLRSTGQPSIERCHTVAASKAPENLTHDT